MKNLRHTSIVNILDTFEKKLYLNYYGKRSRDDLLTFLKKRTKLFFYFIFKLNKILIIKIIF